MPWGWLTRQIVSGAVKFGQSLTYQRIRKGTTLSVIPLERFDEQFDRWWVTVEGAFPCVIRRTSATMSWRYQSHPHHQYYIAAATDGQALRGVIVMRHGRSRGLPAGYISDLLAHPHDDVAIDSLLGYAKEFLTSSSDQPPVFIRCTFIHRAFERALKRAGFLRVPSPTRWMVTHAQGASNLGMLTQRDKWFLNAGDSDLDMV